jgi:threonylcarbamoyladenosine tRNA methylthiotransferase MtaB
MTEQVEDKIKKQRSELLHQLSDKKKRSFYLKNKSRREEVLFESDNSNGWMHGFTRNYLKVKTKFDQNLVNQIIPVFLNNTEEEFCFEI